MIIEYKMLFIWLYLTLFGVNCVNGLICYICSATSNKPTDQCLYNNGVAIGCQPDDYCTIYRQERLDPPNELVAFRRECQRNPPYLNVEVTSSSYREYFTSCKTSYCNIGDGKLIPGSIRPIDEENGNIIVVAGIGHNYSVSSSFSNISHILCFLGLFIFSTIYL